MRLVLLAILLLPAMSMAAGDCKGRSCNSAGGGDIANEIANNSVIDISNTNKISQSATATVGVDVGEVQANPSYNSRAYALSNSLGDVDINDCLASKQWNTPIFGKQTVAPNLWCMAESYDARGLHSMAAFMRCDIEIIRGHFATDEACWEANTVVIAPPPPPPVAEWDDDEEDVHERQWQTQMELAARVDELQTMLERAQSVEPVVEQRVIEQRIGLTPEQKMKLQEVIND